MNNRNKIHTMQCSAVCAVHGKIREASGLVLSLEFKLSNLNSPFKGIQTQH